MNKPTRKPDARTRRAILDHLKLSGDQDAESLAKLIGISAMGVRQHLYALESEDLIGFTEEARPVGRPAKRWHLTSAADGFFPDGHQDLALDLIEAMGAAFGEAGMEKLLSLRMRQQAALYKDEIGKAPSLRKKLNLLSRQRTKEGYMAAVEETGRGRYLLIENHCPICSAAKTCQGLCALELELFQEVLGPEVEVERTDHILAGARRCAYRVQKKA